MRKIMNFFYKTSTVIFTILGIILLTIVAAIVGLMITYGNADTLKDLLEKKLGFGTDVVTPIMDKIGPYLSGIHWEVKELSTAGIVLICIFSVSVGLLGMFVVFGIFSASYRAKRRKEARLAIKAAKGQIDQVNFQQVQGKKSKYVQPVVQQPKQPEEAIPSSAYAYYSY